LRGEKYPSRERETKVRTAAGLFRKEGLSSRGEVSLHRIKGTERGINSKRAKLGRGGKAAAGGQTAKLASEREVGLEKR